MSPLALSVRFLQTQPDRRLIELARAGHERAFEALVQRYRRPLLRYCRRMTPSEATAEDVLQQAFMQAWVALGNPDIEVRDARAWLYRIVHNAAISQLRRPVHDSLDASHSDLTRGTEDEFDRRLEARAALAGLASLPELQREVMLSTALEGRSHDEVADALGLSHGAVRGLIYRARATLRAAAAAVIPSPLVHWAARQGAGAGCSGAVVEALAGGGSVGIGGLIVKGGAVVAAAGAIATAAGIADHGSHRRAHREEAGIVGRSGAHRRTTTVVTAAFTAAPSAASAASGSGSMSHAGSSPGGSGRGTSRGAGSNDQLASVGGRQNLDRFAVSNSGPGGSGGSGSGSGSRHGGGHGDGGGSGSGGSGGSDGSGSRSGSGSGGSQSSGSSGSDGSGSGSGSGSGDSSGSGSHDGHGGSTTTTTATSASAESGDGSGDGKTSGSTSSSTTGSSSGSSGGSGSDSHTTTTHD
jgi:RNA polymerase sigma factor (sigma-70 family)